MVGGQTMQLSTKCHLIAVC